MGGVENMVNLVRKESTSGAACCFQADSSREVLRICLYFLLFTILAKITILTIPHQDLARKKEIGGYM
jgi:hypothetical protein